MTALETMMLGSTLLGAFSSYLGPCCSQFQHTTQVEQQEANKDEFLKET